MILTAAATYIKFFVMYANTFNADDLFGRASAILDDRMLISNSPKTAAVP